MFELPSLTDELVFPHPSTALSEPDGLLAYGGDLSTERLLLAYQSGIFPWYSEDDPILWWSPSYRAVLAPDQLHIARSLRRFLAKTEYRVTLNHCFSEVIKGCSENRAEGTWIVDEIQQAYLALHQIGAAHSVEVWHHNTLIGGLYGVAQGALFCGESMFSRQTNASKVALVAFCLHFVAFNGKLIDCQILNQHTSSLGVSEISRSSYLRYLKQLQSLSLLAECWRPQQLKF